MPPTAELSTASPSTDFERKLNELREWLTSLAGVEFPELCPYEKCGVHMHVDALQENLVAIARKIEQAGFGIETAFAVDRPPLTEVDYLFTPPAGIPRIRVRLTLGEGVNDVPSICSVFRGANWHEREMFDMFGLRFTNHPNLRRILLYSTADFSPLRKNFQSAALVIPPEEEEHPDIEMRGIASLRASTERRDFYINMGPQHPSTHGVLRVLLHVEGEMVLGGQCHLGYSHRGTEKIAESKSYVSYLPYTDRIDYLSPLSYNWGYAALLERATGIESTPRAERVRLVMAELGRVASHCVWLGTFLLDIGAVTPFLYTFEDREIILTFFEKITGQRMTNSYIVAGGVRHDIPDDFAADVAGIVKHMRRRLPEYETLVMGNEIFMQRTVGTGKLTAEQCRQYGVTGPNLRASGVDSDLRRDWPYTEEYRCFQWEPAVEHEGDCYARSRVRMREMAISLNLIEQALENIPEGPARSKVPKSIKVPAGEYYSATEGPRGAVGWWLVADGSDKPYRLKIRVPSFSNLQVIEEMLPGHRVADVVAILGSVDVVIPEIDR